MSNFDTLAPARKAGAIAPAQPVESDATSAEPKAGLDWLQIDLANGGIGNARLLLQMLMEEMQFCYTNAEAAERAQSRVLVLSDAVDTLLQTAEAFFGELASKVQRGAR